MATSAADHSAIRARVIALLERIVGYALPPDVEHLTGLDSLQVLELLVSLEEEFDIDSDLIIEAQPNWWESVTELVASIDRLSIQKHADAASE